jgi:DNA-binding PucR family transcriptional regulator
VEAAAAAGWALPAEVTPVAAQNGARFLREALEEDLLAGMDTVGPYLLLPGRLDARREVMLKAAVPDHRIAVGLTVGLGQAADSLRWARRTLVLATEGAVGDGSPVMCEDHLVTLALRSDPALIDQLTRRTLGALDDMTPGKRRRLTETLRTWLVTRGTAAEMGDRLDVHPQTVRYRMRTLERVLGDRLEDPESRFEIEVVLRALALRDRRDLRDLRDLRDRHA